LYKLSGKKRLESLIVLSSSYTVKETVDRLILLLEHFQMAIYARINRKNESKWHGVESRDVECILFDKPQLSTPIIDKNPTLAMHFPMKIIVWEEDGCQVAFLDPASMLQQHDPPLEMPGWPDLWNGIIQALEK
jgi:uncharacterized protein (DUF302 family)